MSVIFCSLQLGDYKQTVYLFDRETQNALTVGEIEIEQLSEFIAYQCQQSGVNEVLLKAPAAYANTISDEIRAYGAAKYGMNNIEINIME